MFFLLTLLGFRFVRTCTCQHPAPAGEIWPSEGDCVGDHLLWTISLRGENFGCVLEFAFVYADVDVQPSRQWREKFGGDAENVSDELRAVTIPLLRENFG